MSSSVINRLATIAAVSLFMLPTLGYLSITTAADWVRLFPDDAFYYLEIAWNAATAGIVSFDGVNPTNGFHPLQFLFLLVVAFANSKMLLMQVAILQNALLLVITDFMIANYVFKDRPFSTRLLIVAVMCLPFWHVYLWLDAGMEIGLVMFFGCMFFFAWHQAYLDSFRSNRLNVVWGAFAGLLILSRLDMVIPVTPFIAMPLLLIIRRPDPMRKLLLPLGSLAFFFVPYLVWNLAAFGHLIPVSAVVKSNAAIDFGANWRAMTSGSNLGVLSVMTPVVINILAIWCVREKAVRIPLLILLLGNIVWYIYMFLLAKQVFRWYIAFPYVAQSISLAFVLKALIDWFLLKRFSIHKMIPIMASLLALLMQVGFYWGSTKISTTSSYLYGIAEDVNRKLDKSDVLAVFDAGVIGYFAQARVINLDGLANSYEYVDDYLRANRFKEYFLEQGVTHFLARRAALSCDSAVFLCEFDRDRRISFSSEQALADYADGQQFDLVLFSM